ncbi:MAG: ATP-binding protein [Candidatus Eisenbacteria bacterium]|uniref:ATP-binding protein n=1 Tax=Eiseniibacteriota bacterium TaxID=2212470 RepID=A0A937XD49_UNCEI|nr:ATP-binding protein [Candidatus Eisenbacteria bacterium]
MDVSRLLDLPALLEKKSHFLLGPRQTGKSWLVHRALPDARVYDLLETTVFLAISRNPGLLGEEVTRTDRIVVIDEIQRLPDLLNEVHRLIESRGVRFLLTGSSARKLRRGGVNLLGGRARTRYLHPLTRAELGDSFDLGKMASRGLIPSIYLSDDPAADLEAYAGSYLQQEVVAEGATRNVPAFSRFLRIAALCNGTAVNFTNVANDAQVPRTTVYEYMDILKETLIIHELPPWKRSVKRKPASSSKYYFFDVGVAGILQGRLFQLGTPEFGQAFETYIHHELRCRSDYVSNEPLSYWKTTSGFEVDFIIGDHTAIEVKASRSVTSNDLKGLRALAEEKKLKRFICVSGEPRARTVGGIMVLPWQAFLDELWSGRYE